MRRRLRDGRQPVFVDVWISVVESGPGPKRHARDGPLDSVTSAPSSAAAAGAAVARLSNAGESISERRPLPSRDAAAATRMRTVHGFQPGLNIVGPDAGARPTQGEPPAAPAPHPAVGRGGGKLSEIPWPGRVTLRLMERGLQRAVVDVSPNGKARRSAIRTRRGPGSRPGGRLRCAHFSRRSSQVSHVAAYLAGVAVTGCEPAAACGRGPSRFSITQNAADLPGVLLSGRGERDRVASPYEQFGSRVPLDQLHRSTDGARCDVLFRCLVEEAPISRRRFERVERIEREQSVGMYGSRAPV